MSLLEDVFLNDEAGEAQELERVIEGDEFEERPRSPLNSDENSEKEDEAVEDKRRVDPNAKAKRVVKNPRFTLNPARLMGPRGIQIIPEHFKDFKFKGKGHEKEDLDMVLKKLEHWAYRLYPKFQFEDCLKKIETLGKKRPVMVHLHKIRSDQFLSEETVVQKDSSDEETTAPIQEEDEFDKLLQQQIELARATPAPGSVKKPGFATPSVDRRSSLTMPKATSSPSISDEQKERMIRNRKLAEERRLARLKHNTTTSLVDKSNSIEEEPIMINDAVEVRSNIVNDIQNNDVVIEITERDTNMSDTERNIDTTRVKKINRSNVIDSDEESDTENNLVIDMTEKSELSPKKADTPKNMSDTKLNLDTLRAKKINRSNVIDSDEESDTENNLVIDMPEQSELSPKKVDSRINMSNTQVNLDTVRAKKINRSNLIDSDEESDTENNLVIDMTEQTALSPKKTDKRKNKSNIIESDDEANVVVTDKNNLVIDITEEIKTKVGPFSSNTVDFETVSPNKSKNSVIDLTDKDIRVEERRIEQHDDSSDDEEMAVIQSISVDVHVNRNDDHDSNVNAEITEATANMSGGDLTETETEMNGIAEDVDRNETKIKIKNGIENIETNTLEERVDIQKDLEEKVKDKDEIGKKIDGNSKVQDEKENMDSNVLQNEEVQELMDVDFSDDF